jgi:hypothetical protein
MNDESGGMAAALQRVRWRDRAQARRLRRLWVAMMATAFFAASAAPAQTPPPNAAEQLRAAESFMKALGEARYEAAAELVDPSQAERLSAPRLKANWDSFRQRHGALKALGEGAGEVVDATFVATFPAEFDRRSLLVKIAFSESGKIVGVAFAEAATGPPAPTPSAPTTPPYANPEAMLEVDYPIQSGDYNLTGTLTLPKTGPPPPVVILVSGSGAHDRDETTGALKPLRDIAWGLAARGVASVRYDKRTLLYGGRLDASELTFEGEIVEDAVAAVRRLSGERRIDGEAIFVLGHGLAGSLAPLVVRRARGRFGFTRLAAGAIVMAAPTRRLPEVILDQLRHIAGQDGLVSSQETQAILGFQRDIEALMREDGSRPPPVMGLTKRYLKALNAYDGPATAKSLDRPLLIAQGGRDFEVSPTRDFEAWKLALGDAPGASFKFYPDLNHHFIAGEGPSYPSEYARPGNVDERWIEDLADWVKENAGHE